MREHPVLPSLTSGQALHAGLTVAGDVSLILTGTLAVLTLLTVAATGPGWAPLLLAVLTGGLALVAVRLHQARRNLESGNL